MSLPFQLPTSLTLESLNSAFLFLNDRLSSMQAQHNQSIFSLSQSQVPIETIISKLTESLAEPKQGNLYIDVYTFDGILKGINDKIIVKLQELSDNVYRQEQIAEKLFIRVDQTLRLLQKKYLSLETKVGNYISYTKSYFTKALLIARVKRVFSAWKKRAQEKKRGKTLLKKSIKAMMKYPLYKSFSYWKSQNFKFHVKTVENEGQALKRNNKTIVNEFGNIKTNIFALQTEKADILEIQDIKNTATKTDLRVLYNDMRSVLVSYFGNLKNHNTEKICEIKEEMGIIRKDMSKKADNSSLQELSNQTVKLRQEVIETGRKQQNLNEKFVEFNDMINIEKTQFQLEVVEKRLSALEQKIFDEAQEEKDILDMVKQVRSSRTSISPRKSMRLTDVIDRNAAFNKGRHRFTGVVTSKKFS